MKKIIITLTAVLCVTFISYSQNEVDALRYSQNYYSGTARFVGMGGAFGALGGDMSSISINPAGLGVYRKSEFTITPNLYYNATESNFSGSKYTDSKYKLNFNNLGIVGSYTDDNSSDGWKGVSFAFGYNRLNNFNKNILIEGTNSANSLLDVWVDNVNTGNYSSESGEQMALDAGLIYNIVGNDTLSSYISDFTGSSYGQLQRKSIQKNGGMGETFVAFGANFNHFLYLGGSIGFQKLNYSEHSQHNESDPNDMIPYFDSFNFSDHLDAYGNGYNLKFGAIIKPINALRLGIAVHSPTFFNIHEEYSSELESSIDFGSGSVNDNFSTQTGTFNYTLTTPFKAIGSAAIVIGKTGLISVDYEYIDYTKSRMRENKYSFFDENNNIVNRYSSSTNLRIGGEYRFGPLSLRGGYAIYGSPYNSQEANSNSGYSSYSFGFGTRTNNYFIDFAYIYTLADEKYYLYGVQEANLNSTTNQLIATVGFKF